MVEELSENVFPEVEGSVNDNQGELKDHHDQERDRDLIILQVRLHVRLL